MAISGTSASIMKMGPPAPAAYFPKTISCWAFCPTNPSVENTADYFFDLITTIGGNTAYFNPHWVSTGTAPNVTWQCGCNISYSVSGTFDYTTSPAFGPGVWHHFAMTLQDTGTAGQFGSGSAKQYIDGSYVAPGAQPGSPITGFVNTPGTTTLQVQPGSASGNLYIAYPAIWNSILTVAQINQLAAGVDPRLISAGTLASYTQLNSATAPVDLVSGQAWAVTAGSWSVQTDPYLLPPSGTGINISLVGSTGTASNPGTSNPLTLADTWTNLAGDLRYVWVTGPIQVTGVSDSAGNTYTSIKNVKSTATNYYNALYVCLSCKAAAANTVSVTFASAPTSATEIATGEIDPGNPGAVFTVNDGSQFVDGTTTPTQTPNIVTTAQADVILFFPNLLNATWYFSTQNQFGPLGSALWNGDQAFFRVVNGSGSYATPKINLQTGTGANYMLVAAFGVTYTAPPPSGGSVFPPPPEIGPGPADPTISTGFGSYSGTGYGPQPTGRVGTINPYPPTPGT